MTRNAPALTGAQFVDRVAARSRRLTKHLDAWDEGNEDAAEDVAGLVRALLGYGTGNKVIERLRKQHRLEDPLVSVGKPALSDRSTTFSLGPSPLTEPQINRSQRCL